MNQLLDNKHRLLLTRLGQEPSSSPNIHVEPLLELLATANSIDTKCARHLAEFGLSEGRLAVLLAVEAEPRMTAAALAEAVGVTRATITGLIDGLEKQGLLLREPDPADRRSVRLQLTSAGGLTIEALAPTYSSWLDSLLRDIPGQDLAAFTRVLGALALNVNAAGAR